MGKSSPMLTRRDILCFGAGAAVAALGLHRFAKPGMTASPALSAALNAQASVDAHDIDIGYAQSMLVHHQQALLLSSSLLALANSSDTVAQDKQSDTVFTLARQIQAAQGADIQELKGWLMGRQAPALPTDGDLMGWMRRADATLNLDERLYLERCRNSPIGMSGMASNAQVASLSDRQIDGLQRKRMFLQLMVTHHEAAISMSTLPARAAASTYIRNMANHVLSTQSREVRLMQRLLQAVSAA